MNTSANLWIINAIAFSENACAHACGTCYAFGGHRSILDSMNANDSPSTLVSTGIDALDEVLYRGLTPERLYLIEGTPVTGKTTLGLQFLLAGCDRGDVGISIDLSESKQELHHIAKSYGWYWTGSKSMNCSIPKSRLNSCNTHV